MAEELDEWLSSTIANMSTSNLVIALQKLAKNGSHFKPDYRAALLRDAARRLTEYRQAERNIS